MRDLEQKILKHLRARGWDNLRPVDIAKSIMIEGAELLELFQWENATLDEVRKNKEKIEEIKGELADVLIYALELAVLLNLDARSIINKKLAFVAKKYPARLMKKASRSAEPGTESVYWAIKKKYRQANHDKI
jgi:NTP pyrophosphatase (non-canonical NTP hydrolase)